MNTFRRPENVVFWSLGVGLSIVGYSFLVFSRADSNAMPRFPDVVRFSMAATVFCLVGGHVLGRVAYRAAALVLHFFSFVVLSSALEGRFLVLQILFLILLEIQICLSVSPLKGALLNAITLTYAVVVSYLNNRSWVDGGAVALLCGSFAVFCGLVTYYRDQLVEKANALSFQRRALENLASANRSFIEHIENVEEESAERERSRITRELHDSIGYAMTNITMMMNASRYLLTADPAKLQDYCGKTKALAATTLRETRQILYRLRAVNSRTVLSPAAFFIKLCRDFAEVTGVQMDCHVGNLTNKLPEPVFMTLFRAVQVGLTNALTHSNARHITISFWLAEAELRMRIWNNITGVTDDYTELNEGIGLKGVRERLEIVGGGLALGPVADGFELTLTIPREELQHETD